MYNFHSPNQQHRVQTLMNQKLTLPPRKSPSPPHYNPLLPDQCPSEPQFRPSRRMNLAPSTDPSDGYLSPKPQLAPGVFSLSSQSHFHISQDSDLPLTHSKRPINPPTPTEKVSRKKQYPPIPQVSDTSERPVKTKPQWKPSPMTLKVDLRNSEYRGELGLPVKPVKQIRNSSAVFTPETPVSRENNRVLKPKTGKNEGNEREKEVVLHQFIANKHFAGVYRSRTQGSQVHLSAPIN